MKIKGCYFVRYSAKAAEGMLQMVVNVPISKVAQCMGFDEIAQWSDDTELDLDIHDSQLTLIMNND